MMAPGSGPGPSRRLVLAAGAGMALVGVGTSSVAGARGVERPAIHPRAEWATGVPTPRGLQREEAVKFLLVHHTETPNTDTREAIPARLRSIHAFHTGEKGWSDVAYNFFVDAYGGIWEGRAGSLTSPVRGDATGGSQGHALLCCFIGDHTTAPPTARAQEAMASLLAWLAQTYAIDLSAGRTITFVSRGSNKWPSGARVTTTPVAGHRDMSLTACPGDAAYPLVHGAILERAQRLTAAGVRPTGTTALPSSTPAPPAIGAATLAGTTGATAKPSVERPRQGRAEPEGVSPWWAMAGAGAVAAGAVVAYRQLREVRWTGESGTSHPS